MLGLLLLGADRDQRWPGHADRDAARTRRARFGHLFVEDELLHHAQAGSAVLLGPGGRDPAALGQLALPGAH